MTRRRRKLGSAIRGAAARVRERAIGRMRIAADEAVKVAADNTPGKDLPKAWSKSESGARSRDAAGRYAKGGGPFRISIKNVDERMHRPIALKSGGQTTLARIVEYGSRAHRIEAKPGGVLVFNIGGRTVYAKSVDHPGTKARRPHGRAHTAARRKLGKLAKKRGG